MIDTNEGEPCVGELSGSLLRIVDDADKVFGLREILSGFSHRCRNSLNGMKLGFYLCKKEAVGELPSVWSDLEETYELLERTIDRLQFVYRPMTLNLMETSIGSMVAEREASWRLSFAEHGKTLLIGRPSSELPGHFDPMYLTQALEAVVIWRAESSPSRTKARLSWRSSEDSLLIDWSEEARQSSGANSSKPSTECDSDRFELKRRFDSLALPMLARVIVAHEGKLTHSGETCLSLQIAWPRLRSESL